MEPKPKAPWKKESIQTLIAVIGVIAVVVGLWFGSQIVLNTSYPALAVASGSMCLTAHMSCDGYSHPFDRTLHVGDLIIVQGVDPNTIKASPYPDGDIIVFRRPSAGDLIVHRAIASETYENVTYFETKGDANPSADYHYGTGTHDGMISQEMVIGKVVMRIPWVGHLALFMRESWGIYLILILIALLVIVEFALPLFRKKDRPIQQSEA